MNIFVSHPDPYISASYLDDARVVKMILESCQMLNMCLITKHNDTIGYKPTHRNHPCTKWVCDNKAHYTWLYHHLGGLLSEYTMRFRKVHKCQQYMLTFAKYAEVLYNDCLDFVNCTTNHKHIDDVHLAYILELNLKWSKDKNPRKYKTSIRTNNEYSTSYPKIYAEAPRENKTTSRGI